MQDGIHGVRQELLQPIGKIGGILQRHYVPQGTKKLGEGEVIFKHVKGGDGFFMAINIIIDVCLPKYKTCPHKKSLTGQFASAWRGII